MSLEATIDEIIRSQQHNFDDDKYLGMIESIYQGLGVPKEYTMVDEKLALIKKYSKLLDHLDRVCANCRTLAKRIIEKATYQDDFELAHKLIIAGQTHDLSKFDNDEWQYLCDYEKYAGSAEVKVAAKNHTENNFHHPEAWPYGINQMDDVSICELICDWEARAVEFGVPTKEFLETKAFKKYGFSRNSEVFQKMSRAYKLLTGEVL